MTSFHDVRFPIDISLKSSGGPQRRTDVVLTASGREERNQRWIHARRKFDAGYGVKSLTALSAIVAFFEERRGRLYGFRYRDRLDWQSCAPGQTITPADQPLGTGDGIQAAFQLIKRYGSSFAPYDRPIVKPVAQSVRVAVNGTLVPASQIAVDGATGIVTFLVGHIPPAGAVITAGYAFDVPVRFDTDFLEIDLEAFEAGAIPKIPLIEILN